MTRSGEYLDLPAELYHSDPAIGSTDLGLAKRSALHYQATKSGLVERVETDAMFIGTALHCAVLEPKAYADRYAISPHFKRNTKDGKAAAAAWEAAAVGRISIDIEDHALVTSMRDAVLAHPYAGRLLKRSLIREGSYFWTDPETGLPCKCRPDAIIDGALAIDLKKAADADPDSWKNSAQRLGYPRQRAHYVAGLEAVGKSPIEEFVFIVVEDHAPYAVGVYTMDADWIALGEASRRKSLRRIAEATESNKWTSYGDGRPMTLSAPKWAFSEVM